MSTYIPGTGVRATTEGDWPVAVRARAEERGVLRIDQVRQPLDPRTRLVSPVKVRQEVSETPNVILESADEFTVTDEREAGNQGPVWLRVTVGNFRLWEDDDSPDEALVADVTGAALVSSRGTDVPLEFQWAFAGDGGDPQTLDYARRVPVVTEGVYYRQVATGRDWQVFGTLPLAAKSGAWPDYPNLAELPEDYFGEWFVAPGQSVVSNPAVWVYPRSPFGEFPLVIVLGLLLPLPTAQGLAAWQSGLRTGGGNLEVKCRDSDLTL
jgi:hypothetical protein